MFVDFKNRTKSYMTVTLADGTTLLIKMPKKRMIDEFSSLNEQSSSDAIYKVIAGLLSNNVNDVAVSAEYVEENFDVEELRLLMNGYRCFVQGIDSDPNLPSLTTPPMTIARDISAAAPRANE